MNIVGIYKIESPSNKVYIGQSWHIKRRWNDHRATKSYKHKKLNASFLKYGIENHKFDILHILPNDITQDILNRYEQIYIDAFRDCNIGLLNLKEGGNGYGKHTEETKAIIKEKRKYQKVSDEQRQKMSLFFKTIPRTKEWIEKVANSNRSKTKIYEQRKLNMKPIKQLTLDGKFIRDWDCSRNAAKELRTSESNICNCLTGRSKSAKGYKWIYAR
jgi:group I intron endonuclease